MLRTVEAVVENDGSLRLLEDIDLRAGERALVTLLGEDDPAEAALLSETALATDWDREEEEAAWAHLQ
jgi:predicted DNA-binding antitoxin AbrB/MazE fold protein